MEINNSPGRRGDLPCFGCTRPGSEQDTVFSAQMTACVVRGLSGTLGALNWSEISGVLIQTSKLRGFVARKLRLPQKLGHLSAQDKTTNLPERMSKKLWSSRSRRPSLTGGGGVSV